MSNFFAHPSACIDDGALIGEGTKIWHFCHIAPGARIGDRCVLGQNVFVDGGATVGNGCKIQNNVSVFKGVTLEDLVFCGPSCVFTNVVTPRAGVERKSEFAATLVKRGATIGANATIICGTTVGAFALVGAGCVVSKDVPDHALVVGVPGKIIGWVCCCGEVLCRLGELGQRSCSRCGQAYLVSDNGPVQVA